MSEPIEYMERTRRFYQAQGFEAPYQWAHFEEIPFTPLEKPLSEATVAIVTTAVHPDDQGTAMIGRKARSFSIDDIPDRFFTDDLSWDKETTHTRDRGSYFPLETLKMLEEGGVIGRLAQRYHFVPTEYSQRFTLDSDAPAIASACAEDEVDVAILIPI